MTLATSHRGQVDSFGIDLTQPIIDSVQIPGDTVFDSPFIKLFARDQLNGTSNVLLVYWIDNGMPDSIEMNRDSLCFSTELPVDSGAHYIRFFAKVSDSAGNFAFSDTFNMWFIGVSESGNIPFGISIDRTLINKKSLILNVNLPQDTEIKVKIYDLTQGN